MSFCPYTIMNFCTTGITVNPVSGIISGTPTEIFGHRIVRVTAINHADQSVQCPLHIEVVDIPLSYFEYTDTQLEYDLGSGTLHFVVSSPGNTMH